MDIRVHHQQNQEASFKMLKNHLDFQIPSTHSYSLQLTPQLQQKTKGLCESLKTCITIQQTQEFKKD